MGDFKPELDDLREGYVSCPGCSKRVPLSDYEGLSVVDCPFCSTPMFIPVRIKGFWLYEPLGGGGMGSVYKAMSGDAPGAFAVKVLPRSKKHDPALISALEREGRIWKVLGKFPHIAEVVDYGAEDDEHFIASRFVQGTRLDIYISTASRLSERQAIDILSQIIDAELHIVNCGFLYCDIKPENVIIVEETATAKLFDFGLCVSLEKAANPDPSEKLEGSPFYLPPERIVAAPEGEYSEVYSLGMLLFHMLAGETYFSQAAARELVTKHVRSIRIGSVRSKLPHCSDGLVEILDSMIQKDPAARPQSLADLKNRLDDVSLNVDGYALAASDDVEVDESKWLRRATSPKTYLYLFLAVLAAAAVSGGVFAAWRYKQRLEREALVARTVESVASDLGVSPDVKPPDATLEEVADMIERRAREIVAEKEKSLPPFDEAYHRAKICKDLNVSAALDRKTELSSMEVGKLADEAERALEKKELAKIHMVFDAEKAAKDAAVKMGVEYPVPDPSMTPDEIVKLASKKAGERVVEKYPSKMLAAVTAKIVAKYKPHRVGEHVNVRKVTTGELISGEYKGTTSFSKVIIGTKEVLIADLTDLEQIRFKPGMSSVKISQGIKMAKERFNKVRKQFFEKERADIASQLFGNNGYVRNSKGRWGPAKKVVAAAVDKAKKKFEEAKAAKEAAAKTNARRLFDREAFFKRHGYRRVDGKWNSDIRTVELLLAKRRAEFENKRNRTLKRLLAEARKTAAEELYSKHGYIRWNGQWLPAKSVLDKEARDALEAIDVDLGAE